MAAPTINYTDPTFLYTGLKVGLPLLFPRVPQPMRNPIPVVLGQPSADWNFPMLTRPMVKPPAMSYLPKIPTPPMGKILVLTFPSIYKERGNGAATTGQLFPPPRPGI